MSTPYSRTDAAKLSSKGNVSIEVLDRLHNSGDQLSVLKEFVSKNEDKYPGIDGWFARRVVPGLQSGERKAYIVLDGGRSVAAAILKLGESAKLCHLRIEDGYQDASLGQILLIQMAFDLLSDAKEVHFTLPESLWAVRREFFSSFGFLKAEKTTLRYRRDEDELFCSSPIERLYSAVLKKIPQVLRRLRLGRYPDQPDLLMSVKPKFAEKIMNGSKSIEIRRQFSGRWANHDVAFYASQPMGALIGKATVNSVTRGRPDDLWSRFEGQIGCSRPEFDAYVSDADEVTAIEFKNVCAYDNSVALNRLKDLLREKLAPPQSYFGVSSVKNRIWLNAIYLANLFSRKTNSKTHTDFPL